MTNLKLRIKFIPKFLEAFTIKVYVYTFELKKKIIKLSFARKC